MTTTTSLEDHIAAVRASRIALGEKCNYLILSKLMYGFLINAIRERRDLDRHKELTTYIGMEVIVLDRMDQTLLIG